MTSSNASDLSRSPPYGWDVVVGVTQAALNATLKRYLRNLEAPLVEICYVFNEDDDEFEQLPLQKLISKAKGVDPFNVPDGTGLKDDKVRDLEDANFVCAMRIQLGIPVDYDPPGGFNIIHLEGGIHQVQWDLLCATFQIVAIDYNRRKFTNAMQDPEAPWLFSAKLDLRLEKTLDTDHLPEDVQKQIEIFREKGREFEIQTLLFDLSKAYLQGDPEIKGISDMAAVYGLVKLFFGKKYLEDLRKNGEPLLGVVLVPDSRQQKSTLEISGLRYWVNAYMSAKGEPVMNPTRLQSQCTTFNYLCATDGKYPVPSVSAMNWNWISTDDIGGPHGVLAINRSTFATWFEKHLGENTFKPNSIMVVPSCDNGKFSVQDYGDKWGTLKRPNSGTTVISYDFSWGYDDKKDELLYFNSETSYSVEVMFLESTIKIIQHQIWYVSAKNGIGSGNSGFANVVDVKVMDTWQIDVDAQGKLVYRTTSATEDNSKDFPAGKIEVRNFGSLVSNMKMKITKKLTSITPPNDMQTFFFPGGHVFSMRRPRFSANQDLLVDITYKDPAARMHFIRNPTARSVELPKKVTRNKVEYWAMRGDTGARFRTHPIVPNGL